MALTITDEFRKEKDKVESLPVNFYDIFLGSQIATDGDTLHFVGFPYNLDFFNYPEGQAQTYISLGITRGLCNREAGIKVNSINVQVDNVNKAMSAWVDSHGLIGKRVVIRMGFRNILTDSSSVKIIWDGQIEQVSFQKEKMVASIISRFGTMNYYTGRRYRIQCPWQFGGILCTLNREGWKTAGMATDGSLNTIIDAVHLTQADDYWNYGYVEITGGGALGGQKRMIKDFDLATNKITTYYNFSEAITAGIKYIAHKGCDHILDTCKNTFNNQTNFGGFHTIPLRKDY